MNHLLTAVLLLVLNLLYCVGQNVADFDRLTANTSVWLSAAAYCETDTFMSRSFSGFSTGFVTRYVVENVDKDVQVWRQSIKFENVTYCGILTSQGYIGYMPSQSAIYVVFRGSTSIEDWLGNLDVVLTDYSKCDSCEVHEGFHEAQQSVTALVTQCVNDLRVDFPSYSIVVTGHSLGGAMATLTAIDLIESGLTPVRLFTFGSPRVGNEEFAEWASDLIEDRNRVTHYRDIAVHVPSDRRFEHLSGEWYEDKNHNIHACQGANDWSCSYQFFFTNVRDHLEYLTLDMSCEGASATAPQVSAVL